MKYWSLLFGLVSAIVIATFVYSPFHDDWWLPSYQGTNAEALATLEEIRDRSAEEARTLGALGSLQSEATADQLRDVDQTRRWLERQSAVLGRLIRSEFLTNRSRAIESQIATSRAAVSEARDALAVGPAPEQVDAAVEGLGQLGTLSAETLASVVDPGGSIRAPISSAGTQIDHLYVLILIITGVTFFGVAAALVVALWRFGAKPGRKAHYSHGSLKVEIAWTIVPAAILLFIAIYQFRAWADIKFRSGFPDVKPLAEVTARQFQWKIRYPGPDGIFGTSDDLHTVNQLHFVKDEPTIIHLKSEDVIHSFFLPQMRIKQDAVPGMTIPVLFDARKAGRYELLCAELCGWGHYKMRAEVTVHESRDEFDEWMTQSLREQGRSDPSSLPSPADVAAASANASGPRVE